MLVYWIENNALQNSEKDRHREKLLGIVLRISIVPDSKKLQMFKCFDGSWANFVFDID